MAKKIYRNIIRFEILSDRPLGDGITLSEIENETTDGEWSGRFLDNEVSNQPLEGMQAVEAIKAQGSDTEFFNMDKEGNDIDE